VSGQTCDFCNSTEARWALRCDDVGVLARGAHGTAVATLAGAWTACDACMPFVERRDPDGLADYVVRAGHGPPALLRLTSEAFRRDVFYQLYKRVVPMLGPPQPLAREAVGGGGPLTSAPEAQP